MSPLLPLSAASQPSPLSHSLPAATAFRCCLQKHFPASAPAEICSVSDLCNSDFFFDIFLSPFLFLCFLDVINMPKKHPRRLFLRIFYHPCGLLARSPLSALFLSLQIRRLPDDVRPSQACSLDCSRNFVSPLQAKKNKVSQILRYLVLLSGLSFLPYLFASYEQIFSVCLF